MLQRNRIYYRIKPFVPRPVQILLRRGLIFLKKRRCGDRWPIQKDSSVHPPDGWTGWPEKKKFAVILTHDVDSAKGQERCLQLMDLEKKLGFRSSFNFIPERYKVLPELRRLLARNEFEVGVHDLNHDGKLYDSKSIFEERSKRINKYLEEWECVGFRSGAMHHNLEWLHELNIEYDASTFDTDPFEPQPDGTGTIFPFWVQEKNRKNGYVELPYTIPQDFTLFVLLKEKTIDIWKRKLDWVAENGGMALLITHPDYMNFTGRKPALEEYPADFYVEFLRFLNERYGGQYWHAVPREAASFFKRRGGA
jgi:hypothetical protein